MDLKSELRMSLFGTTSIAKIEIPADLNDFQKKYMKFYAGMGDSQYYGSPLTSYKPADLNPLTPRKVLLRVNVDAVFPKRIYNWVEADYNAFITTMTNFGLYYSNQFGTGQAQPAQVYYPIYIVPCFVVGKAGSVFFTTTAQHDNMVGALKNILGVDLSSYPAVATTVGTKAGFMFHPDLVAKVSKMMIDYIDTNLPKYYDYLRYGINHDQATIDSYRVKAKDLINNKKVPPYYEYSMSGTTAPIHDYQVLAGFVGLYTNYKNHHPYEGFDFSSYRLLSTSLTSRVFSYPALTSSGTKEVTFTSTVQYVEDSVGIELKKQAAVAVAVATNIRNNFMNTNGKVNMNFFNFLIFMRDHYIKYQSTGFVFSDGDGNLLNAYKSGNIQTILSSQLPKLSQGVIESTVLNKATYYKVVTGTRAGHENLLKFLYVVTMGYLKSGQVITSNLQPYFTVGDTQQSVYNRFVSMTTMLNGKYVWPVFLTDILGTTDVSPDIIPNGAMVLKLINDVLKEADAFLKYYT